MLGEKIFFNPRDHFFILQKHSQKQQTQARVPSTLGVSVSINRIGGRKTKACEEKKASDETSKKHFSYWTQLSTQTKLN
jgi:hypothetical protein